MRFFEYLEETKIYILLKSQRTVSSGSLKKKQSESKNERWFWLFQKTLKDSTISFYAMFFSLFAFLFCFCFVLESYGHIPPADSLNRYFENQQEKQSDE